MKVTAQYAEEHFADILHAADKGEEIEIARPDQRAYCLEVVKPVPAKPTGKRILGAGRGKMIVPGEGLMKSPSIPSAATAALNIRHLRHD